MMSVLTFKGHCVMIWFALNLSQSLDISHILCVKVIYLRMLTEYGSQWMYVYYYSNLLKSVFYRNCESWSELTLVTLIWTWMSHENWNALMRNVCLYDFRLITTAKFGEIQTASCLHSSCSYLLSHICYLGLQSWDG